jgi:hypothetical protein
MRLITFTLLACLSLPFVSFADDGKDNCGQQANAKGLKGKARKDFMKACTQANKEDRSEVGDKSKKPTKIEPAQAPSQPAPQPPATTQPAPLPPVASQPTPQSPSATQPAPKPAPPSTSTSQPKQPEGKRTETSKLPTGSQTQTQRQQRN